MARGKRRALTPELEQTICDAIVAGNTRECAAQAAGASVRWLYEQIAENAEFAAAITRADAQAEAAHVQVIQTAARRGNFAASQFWLERRRPQEWGKVDRLDITIRQQAQRVADELGMTVEEVLAEADRIVQGAA